MQRITRRMTTADDAMFKAYHFKQKAESAGAKFLELEKAHPNLTFTSALILALLVLFLPFFTDPPIAKPAIDTLMSATQSEAPGNVENRPSEKESPSGPYTPRALFFVLGETALVFLLSYAGKVTFHDDVENGVSSWMFQVAGLFAALAIPAMAIATTLRQVSVKTLLETAQERMASVMGAPPTPPTWADTAMQNLDLIVFAVFSGLAHFLVWACAPKIAEAFDILPIIARKSWYSRAEDTNEKKFVYWQARSKQIIVTILRNDKQLMDKFPDEVFEFRYVTAHPKVAEIIEAYRHKDNDDGHKGNDDDEDRLAAA